ncbi:ATP synthase gamma chain [uncultured archaeon]|nr:ATP synthase gamma chain [uncultured archaeon]
MEQLEILKRKMESARELRSLVKTMKVLAAVSIREYGQAVESLVEYNRAIEMGLQIVMRNRPGEIATGKEIKKNRFGAVIFGSEQGLCGRFNEQIAQYAIERMDELKVRQEDRTILALGERVIARLEEAGQKVEERFSFFGNHSGITAVMQQVLVKIEEWRLERGIEQIVLFYNRPVSGAAFSPNMLYLLPLDMEWLLGLEKKEWPSRTLPTFTMDWDELFSSLVRHYLFFSLYRAFVESLASENASRLSAMQVAEKNIDERLNELSTQFHGQRQSRITEELLDIITGFEALTGEKSREG